MGPWRAIGARLLLWAAAAFAFTFLWAPADEREPYAWLAALAFGAWWPLRRVP